MYRQNTKFSLHSQVGTIVTVWVNEDSGFGVHWIIFLKHFEDIYLISAKSYLSFCTVYEFTDECTIVHII